MLDARYEFDFVPGKARIAVIDDDSVFIDLMHDLLAHSEGYEVVSSSEWIRGHEFIKNAQPDLVILDLMMGHQQNGSVVLRSLQEDPSTAHIPVILCSAAESALHQHTSRATGKTPVEAVSKPFDVDHLLGVIARLLEQPSLKPDRAFSG